MWNTNSYLGKQLFITNNLGNKQGRLYSNMWALCSIERHWLLNKLDGIQGKPMAFSMNLYMHTWTLATKFTHTYANNTCKHAYIHSLHHIQRNMQSCIVCRLCKIYEKMKYWWQVYKETDDCFKGSLKVML